MRKEEKFILWFNEINIKDVNLVGGKNAALGEMFQELTPLNIKIPNGFAITAFAYQHFLKKSGLKEKINKILKTINTHNIKDLQKKGKIIRNLILKSQLPQELEKEIIENYQKLNQLYKVKNVDVAVRSSATAEDLPGASFAGQQETYLNIQGEKNLILAVKKCIASLFTDRAISYRVDKGFNHEEVSLSVGVQKMVRSDLASSGVMFTIDTETGFNKVIIINSIYGLGELIVKGEVTPDEFIVFKPTLKENYKAIIAKNLGQKDKKLVYFKNGTKKVKVNLEDQKKYSLNDEEILKLALAGLKIEEHFSKKHNHYQPMDIEWAKDGKTNEIYIIQARPETIHSLKNQNSYEEYVLEKKSKILTQGIAVGTKIKNGNVKIIKNPKKLNEFKPGEILVTEITDPDWEPIMKIASAIITEKGGRTSHAAIVSRELGIPCIVGTNNATKVLKNKQKITVDCSSGKDGFVFEGYLPYKIITHQLDKIEKTKTKIMLNIGSPEEAFKYHYLPIDGIGLGRLEFIILSHIKIHPNALIDFKKLKQTKNQKIKKIVNEIEKLTLNYKDKTQYYVDELAEGIAKIASIAYPKETIIRFSDFKTNEYKKLIGGELYEPTEENPMLGWRGASRYYDEKFEKAFGLECLAIKKAREEIGLKNISVMIPFCRTIEEGQKVLQVMKKYGLDNKKDKDFKIYVMCEIPSNILLADQFLEIFDGMSIGSNDLSQLTLGIDRDSEIVNKIANENNPAVKKLIKEIIKKCKEKNKYIGICGQAPSDYLEFAEFLVENEIESISLNPDSIIKTIEKIKNVEKNKEQRL